MKDEKDPKDKIHDTDEPEKPQPDTLGSTEGPGGPAPEPPPPGSTEGPGK